MTRLYTQSVHITYKRPALLINEMINTGGTVSNSSLTVLILKYKCLTSMYSAQWIRVCSTDKRSWQPTQTGRESPQSKCRCVKYVCPIRRRQRIIWSLWRSWDEWCHNPNSGCTVWSLLWTCLFQKTAIFSGDATLYSILDLYRGSWY